MMDNFPQILLQIPTCDASSSRSRFEGVKVQVNFNIPIFEAQIDVDVVNKWLNMLEGYFLVHSFSDQENITFSLLKVSSHVND